MASKPTSPAINGGGPRQCPSWIESFVQYTDNLESAPIFRKWAAITALGAVLEQRVWVDTGGPLFPNLYVFLVGNAGIGKSRSITTIYKVLRELKEIHFAPTSMTRAALVDCLLEAKRSLMLLPDPMVEYNSMFICADELSAFMDQYDTGLVAGLTQFYDVSPYAEARRKFKDDTIKILRPQLSILTGTTPNNLIRIVPEFAWEQGFTSRVILIYSIDRPMIDIFETPNKEFPTKLVHDLSIIASIYGQFDRTDEYSKALHNWKI